LVDFLLQKINEVESMEIRKKIASKYLQNQYKKAQKYLVKEVNSGADIKKINMISDRVRRAGIAYAQTEYCVFFKDGTYEERKSCEIKDNSILIYSFYNEFVKQMEDYIRSVIGLNEKPQGE
jgi:mRNA-degrading endonuclease YafQ of YafQ-DinJ toxin-antitoxin module